MNVGLFMIIIAAILDVPRSVWFAASVLATAGLVALVVALCDVLRLRRRA